MLSTYDNGNGPDLYATGNDSFKKTHGSKPDGTATNISLDTGSISHLFESSMRGYGALLVALQMENLHSTLRASSLIPEVKDEFSRLRIWGEQTYAVLPQNARRSLDEQLREDEDTKRIVTGSLRRLNNQIARGWVRSQDVCCDHH
jgi:hypothetical protein